MSLESHEASSVTSALLPSEKVAVAVKARASPTLTVGSIGVTSIDTSVGAAVTVSVVAAAIPSRSARMVVVPGATPVTRPLRPGAFETVAVSGALDDQTTVCVRFLVAPLAYVPIATKNRTDPTVRLGSIGDTEIATGVASVTVRLVPPVTPPIVARIDVIPDATPVAIPLVPAAFDTVATASSSELHTASSVTSAVLRSAKSAIAVSCRDAPSSTLDPAGVTSIATSGGADVTVSTVDPVIPPAAYEMVDVPGAIPVARPSEPEAFDTDATAPVADAHEPCSVRSADEPSEKVPIAVNCSVLPAATLGLLGTTATD